MVATDQYSLYCYQCSIDGDRLVLYPQEKENDSYANHADGSFFCLDVFLHLYVPNHFYWGYIVRRAEECRDLLYDLSHLSHFARDDRCRFRDRYIDSCFSKEFCPASESRSLDGDHLVLHGSHRHDCLFVTLCIISARNDDEHDQGHFGTLTETLGFPFSVGKAGFPGAVMELRKKRV